MATGRIPINGTAAIQSTIVDAKGDLIAGTGADAVSRLAVGTNGHTLVADSSTSTGLKWAAPAAGGTRGLNQIVPTSVAVGSGTSTVGANGLITVTGVGTNISINGVFTSTYTNYKVVYALKATSSYTSLNMRMRVGGSDNSTANSYKKGGFSSDVSALSNQRVVSDKWQTLGFVGDDATNGGEMTIYRPYLTEKTAFNGLFTGNAAGDDYYNGAGGYHTQATSYDGFSFLTTQDLTGTITIYGWSE